MKQHLEGRIDAIRAKRPKRLPTVLTREEVSQVLNAMSGTPQLIARLIPAVWAIRGAHAPALLTTSLAVSLSPEDNLTPVMLLSLFSSSATSA